MVNFKEEIAKLIAKQVSDLSTEEIQSMIEVPQDSKMGDYAFPCFKLAKTLRKAPPLIAKGIAEQIAEDPMFEKVEQVNAYVNMFISKKSLSKMLYRTFWKKMPEYGKTKHRKRNSGYRGIFFTEYCQAIPYRTYQKYGYR